MNTSLEAGFISAATVFVGVLLAEWLHRLGERPRRRFELVLNGRSKPDAFVQALDESDGHVSWVAVAALNDVQANAVELQALTRLRSLRWKRRQRRVAALKEFVLLLAAARFRLANGDGVLTGSDIGILKVAIVWYQQEFGSQITDEDRERVVSYAVDGLDQWSIPEWSIAHAARTNAKRTSKASEQKVL